MVRSVILAFLLNCTLCGFINAMPQEYKVIEQQVLPDTTYNPDDEIFTVVEDLPEFTGGHKELEKFLKENLRFPDEARKTNISRTVYVRFVVEKSGRLNHIEIIRGVGYGCDEEAIRLVKAMPKWKAGKQRGKPVRVQFILPVKFHL